MTALLESTDIDVAQIWRDPAFRASLGMDELETLPASPIGELRAVNVGEITSGESAVVSILSPAGCLISFACTWPCCAW
ncbi:mersacidin/lichenicidin family type 2 lantibiotic [Longispora albida]|uniref:mersacidin/lichenicidin family type 2 lantibiotic n=1 Tax=Longispora albida TaxID=203523 RepID=UPI00036DFF7D|nr:mersacidin/lichenicidin family type 2 lantibiotic [Longispora albida]